MDNYEDIINLPHPEPTNRRRMSMEARAAQFAPFAALSGHEEVIEETQRQWQHDWIAADYDHNWRERQHCAQPPEGIRRYPRWKRDGETNNTDSDT